MAEDDDRPYDASEPADVRKRIKEAQRWDDKRVRVIQTIMGTEDGRRLIREYLELTRLGQNPFNTDALKMAFNCGEINVGQRIMADVMNATPELYMRMMQEANAAATPEQKDETNG